MFDVLDPAAAPRSPEDPLQFHQGTVLEWDAIAGTNKIDVLGVEMDDLPSLIGSEVGLIRPDDRVGLLRFQSTYFVLGRIEFPGSAQRAFGMVSHRITGPGSAVSTTSSSFVALSGGPSVSVHIGSSRRCRIELGAYTSSYAGVAYMGFSVSGASSIAPSNRWALAAGGSAPSTLIAVDLSATRVITLTAADGLNEGDNVFTTAYQFLADDPTGIPEWSDREISVQPY